MTARAAKRRKLQAIDQALKAMFRELADTTPPHLAETFDHLAPGKPSKAA